MGRLDKFTMWLVTGRRIRIRRRRRRTYLLRWQENSELPVDSTYLKQREQIHINLHIFYN
jgi:hypothetical protein